MGDNVKCAGMVDAPWCGLFLFRFDWTEISVIDDYAVVHCHVGWSSSGLDAFVLFLIAVVCLGIHDHILEI